MPLSEGPEDGARGVSGLSWSRRIQESWVFRDAFDQGRRYCGNFMVLWVRSGPGASLRLGVVTSRRSFRRAVDRSRARRRLREAFRRNRFRLRGDFDIVIVARSRILDASAGRVETEWLALAGRAGLLPKNGTTTEGA